MTKQKQPIPSHTGQGLTLQVYNGGRKGNVGKTLEIIGDKPDWKESISHIYVVYKGEKYKARLKTYRTKPNDTLRHKDNIDRDLIQAHGWIPGMGFPCACEDQGENRLFIIQR